MGTEKGIVALMILAILTITSLSVIPAAAATPEQIEQSVSSGLAWLVGVQNPSDGSWGDYFRVAKTSFAVLKLEDRALELGYSSPFDPNYKYSGNVENGLDFLFKNALFEGTDSIYFGSEYPVYSTSLAMMAIAKSNTPARKVGSIGSPIDGWDYKTVEKYAQAYLIKAQKGSGGWNYELDIDPNERADNSNSGYVIAGLTYAQEKFGIAIPSNVKDGINRWIDYIQCNDPADPGGSGYSAPCDWNNILKTGNILYQMSVVGDTSATPRVQNAIHYIERHWNDPSTDPGWISNGVPHYQAAFAMMKGLEAMNIQELSVSGTNVDWFDVMSTAIINNQQADGSWPGDVWGDQLLATEWALLALERVVEVPNGRHFKTMESFEELLRDQHKLLVSFNDLMGQTPETREQKIEFLYSIEDLYRRQAIGMDRFSLWINLNWDKLDSKEKAQITDSLEDLLRRQAKNLEAFNGNLLAWVKTFEQPYRQKFSDSFEDLLHRQAALLKKFVFVLHQDGMQTPLFLSSLEDLLRRQAQSLEGFGDLGEFTFDPAPPLVGPGIAIYKTADKTSLSCSEKVTYNYTVYNNGDQEVTGIEVTDPNLPGGPVVGTIPSLGVYQSETIEKIVTYGCLPDVVYPTQVCNNATAKGTTSSGATVEAKSNEVCIILNGPRQPTPPEKCPDRSNYPGQGVTVRGGIVKGAENCIILTADDGSVYELGEDDAESWVKVQDILAKGGCAEISGCAYVGLPTTCQQGTLLYVKSCKEVACPEAPELLPCTPMTNAKGKPVSGVLATKMGPLGDPANSCPYILYYSYQVSPNGPTETKKYWLTVDEANNQYKAEHEKLLNHGKGDYVKVYGCIYEGLESPCEGVPDAIPMYVRSVEVYSNCEIASQVPFIDRGTIIQDTSCVVFSSATGHGNLELLQDPNYLDAWKIIEDFKDTSKMVEIYGCLDPSDVIGNCELQIWHVRAAVPLVGAMAIEPIEKVPNEVVPSSEGCKTCNSSVPDASAKPIVAIPEGNQTQVAFEVTDKSSKPMSKIPEGSQSGLEGYI